MTKQNKQSNENTISIGTLTLASTNVSMVDLIGLAHEILEDKVFKDHITTYKLGGNGSPASYID